MPDEFQFGYPKLSSTTFLTDRRKLFLPADNNLSTPNLNDSKPEGNFKVLSWSDTESPVMVLEPKKIKWMIISPQLDSETTKQLKDAVGRELTFVLTLKVHAFSRAEDAKDLAARCSAVISKGR